MIDSLWPVMAWLFAALATYWMHSTIITGCILMGLSGLRIKNHSVRGRLFILAVTTPLLTAAWSTHFRDDAASFLIFIDRHYTSSANQSGDPHTSPAGSDAAAFGSMSASAAVRTNGNLRSHFETKLDALSSSDGILLTRRNTIPLAISLCVGLAIAWIVMSIWRVLWQTNILRCELQNMPVIHQGPCRELLDGLVVAAKVRCAVLLRESEVWDEPAACGIWQWQIVVPRHLVLTLTAAEMRALLAHELAHLVRRDVVVSWCGRLWCSCCVFQPLNRLAFRRWRESAEFLCDEWAVAMTAAPVALASCLTRAAEWRMKHRDRVAGLAATTEPPPLVRRVERLLGEGRFVAEPRWKAAATCAACGALVIATSMAGPCVALAKSDSGLGKPAATTLPIAGQEKLVQVPQDMPDSDRLTWTQVDREFVQLQSDIAQADEMMKDYTDDPTVRQLWRNVIERLRELERRRENLIQHELSNNLRPHLTGE